MVSSQGELALGMHRGPRVAYTGQGIVISAVVGQQGKGKDGDVMAWRSLEGGKNWSAPDRLNDAPGSTRESLHALHVAVRATQLSYRPDIRAHRSHVMTAQE